MKAVALACLLVALTGRDAVAQARVLLSSLPEAERM